MIEPREWGRDFLIAFCDDASPDPPWSDYTKGVFSTLQRRHPAMITFYLWVLFLLGVILSVPIVHFVGAARAKKAKAASLDKAKSEAAQADASMDDEVEEAVEEAVEDEFAEFGSSKKAGQDDFSAFDQEFK